MRTFAVLTGLLLVGGCAPQLPDLSPAPSPQQMESAGGQQAATAIDLPIGDCKQKQVQHPAQIGMNARVALKLTDHALSIANGHIINGNGCIDDAAAGYARGLTRK